MLQGRPQLPEALPRDAFRLFPFVETFLRTRNRPGAFVVEYAETVVPDGDVLLHCGDFTQTGTPQEVRAFCRWFGALPHPR